jgi:hypothetical protein
VLLGQDGRRRIRALWARRSFLIFTPTRRASGAVTSSRPVSAIVIPVAGDGVSMMPVVMMPVMIVRGLRSSANGHNY